MIWVHCAFVSSQLQQGPWGVRWLPLQAVRRSNACNDFAFALRCFALVCGEQADGGQKADDTGALNYETLTEGIGLQTLVHALKMHMQRIQRKIGTKLRTQDKC